MLELNLLPPKEKKDLEFEKTYTFVISVIMIIFIFGGLVASILYGIQAILSTNLHVLNYQISFKKQQIESGKYSKLSEDITNLNDQLKLLAQLETNHEYPSKIIKDWANLVPSGIQITSLSIDLLKEDLSIKGKAKTRNDLLTFKENLENSKKFKNIQSPLSNLVLDKDIVFEFSGELNQEAQKGNK